MREDKSWPEERKNLLINLQKFPGLALDVIDSAYLAGLQEKNRKRMGSGRMDSTFDRTLGIKGMHTCCQSRVSWRHKNGCKNAITFTPDDYSDIKLD